MDEAGEQVRCCVYGGVDAEGRALVGGAGEEVDKRVSSVVPEFRDLSSCQRWYDILSSRRLPFRRSAGTSGCMAPCPCVRRSMPADSHCPVARPTQRLLPQCRRVGRQRDRSSCAASSTSLRKGLSSAFRVGYSLVTMRATAPPAAAVARGVQDRQARPAGWWGWRETPRVVTERRAEDIRA